MAAEISLITKACLFTYYVAMGCAVIIFTRASASKETGKITYDTTVFIFLSELLKLSVAEIWDHAERRKTQNSNSSSSEKLNTNNPSTSTSTLNTTSWRNWIRYAAPSIIYCVTNNLNVFAVVLLGGHVFALFSNTKLIFGAVTNYFFMGQKFTTIQWTALSVLMLAMVVAKIKSVLNCGGSPSSAPRLSTTAGEIPTTGTASALGASTTESDRKGQAGGNLLRVLSAGANGEISDLNLLRLDSSEAGFHRNLNSLDSSSSFRLSSNSLVLDESDAAILTDITIAESGGVYDHQGIGQYLGNFNNGDWSLSDGFDRMRRLLSESNESAEQSNFTLGFMICMLTSFLSGMAGTVSHDG